MTRMRIQLAFGLLLLLLIVACSKAAVTEPTNGTTPTVDQEMQEVSAELDEIEAIDADLNFSDLDTLDEDLDFG